MDKKKYNVEKYWTEVGERISGRDGTNVIAGDDEPYYRYKRKKLISLFKDISFSGKSVLEVGCGPGGNLKHIFSLQPKKLAGVDISKQMVELASKNLPKDITIQKIDGKRLPFSDHSFDIIFTSTVLQHNTEESMLQDIMKEICRVAKREIHLFEKVDSSIKGDELCMARPISYYADFMKKNGFEYISTTYLNIRMSYYICGAIRKGLNASGRQEGEPLNKLSVFLQNLTLPVTKILDKIFPTKKDVAKISFKRV